MRRRPGAERARTRPSRCRTFPFVTSPVRRPGSGPVAWSGDDGRDANPSMRLSYRPAGPQVIPSPASFRPNPIRWRGMRRWNRRRSRPSPAPSDTGLLDGSRHGGGRSPGPRIMPFRDRTSHEQDHPSRPPTRSRLGVPPARPVFSRPRPASSSATHPKMVRRESTSRRDVRCHGLSCLPPVSGEWPRSVLGPRAGPTRGPGFEDRPQSSRRLDRPPSRSTRRLPRAVREPMPLGGNTAPGVATHP